MRWYAADFETCNAKEDILNSETRVWLWDVFDPIFRVHYTGLNIQTFCNWIFKQKSCLFYFHNLKFDGAFLLNHLLQNGFSINDSEEDRSISTLITDRLTWYTFTVHYNGRKYKFRDSLKKITGTLEQAAKDFDLPIRKGEIEYDKYRPEGYEATKEEIEYCHNDTEILADIMKFYYDNGMTAITNASDAMKKYKEIIGEKAYQHYFPIIDKEIDDFIRRSYKGGFCYVNPKFKNKFLHNIYCYDVKSMYPSVMAQKPLPYGLPVHYIGRYQENEQFPLYIQEIEVDCDLKQGFIPSIQTKTFFSIKLQYLTSTEGRLVRLVLTSLDLERLKKDYNIHEIHYIQGYMFQSSTELFKEYVMKFFELKEQSKGAKKQLYKIYLNSLYGKFAMATERSQAYPEIVDGTNKYIKTDKEIVDATYTAVASFITSWARNKLLEGIYKNIKQFVYCDTDSIHMLAPAVGLNEGKQLGQFAIEHGYYENKIAHTNVKIGKYLGQKCYILAEKKDNETIEIKKIAGAPSKVKEEINFKNFKYNFSSNANLYPKYRVKNVKGGVVLVPTSFTIKEK